MNFIPQTTAATADAVPPAHQFKHPLKLHRNPEEWDETNTILSAVAAASLEAISAKEKTPACAEVSMKLWENASGLDDLHLPSVTPR